MKFMKMPNAEHAVVDINKIRGYCLNSSHFRGQHKARVFAATMGLSAGDADMLQQAFLNAAYNQQAVSGKQDKFGRRYFIDFFIQGPKGRAMVRSMWIIKHLEDFPRFISCYVL